MKSIPMVRRRFLQSALVAAAGSSAGQFASAQTAPLPRRRARNFGIAPGKYPTGKWNAITDVAGVQVGHCTVIQGSGPLQVGKGPIRTGVTAVLARPDIWTTGVFAAAHTFNGDGEMTGIHWIRDLETLTHPILLTNTQSVGAVHDAALEYITKHKPEHRWGFLPVVAETFDGFLNDIQGRHIRYPHVAEALENAKSGPVAEGNVGGGTGMICYRFKGGIGTSSRVLPAAEGGYTIGVLVQANFGAREQLMVTGVPVGSEIPDMAPSERRAPAADDGKEGSLIIVVATDAPLSSRQLERVARRAALGMARTGSTSGNSSGDLFLSFSTGNAIPSGNATREYPVKLLSTNHVEPVFRATVECTEEAILNALMMAQTMEGINNRVVHALPYDRLGAIMAKYGRPLRDRKD